jgi:UPF0755 protein
VTDLDERVEPADTSGMRRPGILARRRMPVANWHHDPWDDLDVTEAVVLERTRRSRWPFKVVVWLVTMALVAAVLTFGGVAWWYLQRINPPGDPLPPVTFTIGADETVESLSERLEAEGIITDAEVFRWYVERQGGLELTPGFFLVRPEDHMGNIMRVFSTPPEETFTTVTFPEGYTLTRMANRLAERQPRLLVTDFMAAATNGSVRSEFQPEGTTSLEGLLFPDTYQVSNGENVEQVIERMMRMMERVGRQERIVERGYVQGLSAYNVLVVASMVEREAKVDEDRALIARVILNRLAIGMPLQIDATLYYNQNSALSFDQLKAIDSPYNTYMYTGLPPTPIANPGRASIQAVLAPANNPPQGGALCKDLPRDECKYLYYVLADEEGRHAFAVTFDQHNANIAASRAAGILP